MNWRETLRTGLEAVRAHRLRSALTMLGILIGIAAVILTVGFGEGASAQIRTQINSLGTNLLIITPGSATSSGGAISPLGSATTLTLQDAGALASKTAAPDIAAVTPTSVTVQTLTAGTANWTTTVVGTTPTWLKIRARSLAEGRFLTAADEKSVADVTVLGPTTASKLFARSNPLGQTVNVNGVPLEVVGVLTSAGASSSATNEDDQALVPMSTLTQQIGGASATSVQHHLRRGQLAGHPVRRLPGGERAAAQPARGQREEPRLHHQQPAVAALHRGLGEQDADRAARPGSPRSRCWWAASGS